VIIGEPGYVTAALTFQRAGAILNRVPVDDYGINVEAIEKLCKRKKIRFVYLIPHHHHPTTVTLSLERRIRLLNLASQYKFAIIEDDYDFHYNSSPILPMTSLDQRGNVIYVGTLSKTLVPAVRIGFLVAPKDFIAEATAVSRSIDFQGDSLLEIAIAELYRSGFIAS
jgi:GntR family transcriptional regulator / MocR family aminotransferase